MLRKSRRILFVAAAWFASGMSDAFGDAKPGKAAVEPPPFTAEREAAALEFVAQHHPELTAVLTQLKGLRRDEYERAIRELSQTRENLAATKSSDEELHRLMLEAWIVNSRIELLAARYACATSDDPALEAELKQLVYRQVDLFRVQVEHNRRRAAASLAAMDANIKWLGDKREELAERRFQNFTQGHRKNVKPTPKAAPTAGASGSKVPRSGD